mgnify:CR=1 FL=1
MLTDSDKYSFTDINTKFGDKVSPYKKVFEALYH